MENKQKLIDNLLQWDTEKNPLAPLSSSQLSTYSSLSENLLNSESSFRKNVSKSETDEKNQKLNVNIESTEDFFKFYDKIAETWITTEIKPSMCLANELKYQLNDWQEMLNKMDKCMSLIDVLEEKYSEVSKKTNSLYLAGEALHTDQTSLSKICYEINERLSIFNAVENIQSKLDSSTFIVSSEVFSGMMASIDNGISYLNDHSSYKESNKYLALYINARYKALSLIQTYVSQCLQTGTESLDTTEFIAYYGKFQAIAAKIKPVIELVEKRISLDSVYTSSLDECVLTYVTRRKMLLGASISNTLLKYTSTGNDYCSTLRSACKILIQLTHDENRLYQCFFTIKSSVFREYLETVCMNMYDTLRPLVIHMKHFETLVELCTILRIEILQDYVYEDASLEVFGSVAELLLQDIQERLVFRANLYFVTDIAEYKPSPGDLAYPEKLKQMEAIAEEMQYKQLTRHDSTGSLFSSVSEAPIKYSSCGWTSAADLHGMWYPPVRRTLMCLSRLYRCVDKTIFQSLSHEAVTLCLKNIRLATLIITQKKSPTDGSLFEIKHLLIIREQIAPFQVDFTIKELNLDFSKMKNAAWGLLQKHDKMFSLSSSNAIIEFLLEGTPVVQENSVDSRRFVDITLKESCQTFINHSSHSIISPLSIFLDEVQKYVKWCNMQGLPSVVKQQEFAQPQSIQEKVQETQEKIKNILPKLHQNMTLYLANSDTQLVLYRPIKNNILNIFTRIQQFLVTNNYTQEEQQLISCPTPEKVSVLLSSSYTSVKSYSRKTSTVSINEDPSENIEQS
ncbi:conserved oligomeric Golgi complex subunit 3 [Daktulosphaira vitifoliae]|uniref:conserved oligomeric Golgi complex subunit 3 n=1 Tax=Daktulosphaira vitifoliae TaxID=58002 RepID=UPI0021A97B90|nr:conserved oligomeric Golgi complex subunit 3 [Daktulosphaira vitifoliae]